jgi:hypothetical protein
MTLIVTLRLPRRRSALFTLRLPTTASFTTPRSATGVDFRLRPLPKRVRVPAPGSGTLTLSVAVPLRLFFLSLPRLMAFEG